MRVAQRARRNSTPTVGSVTSMSGGQTVFNLEVDSQHTYFAGGLLVHNKQPVCDCAL